jgi:hypothetical protein
VPGVDAGDVLSFVESVESLEWHAKSPKLMAILNSPGKKQYNKAQIKRIIGNQNEKRSPLASQTKSLDIFDPTKHFVELQLNNFERFLSHKISLRFIALALKITLCLRTP